MPISSPSSSLPRVQVVGGGLDMCAGLGWVGEGFAWVCKRKVLMGKSGGKRQRCRLGGERREGRLGIPFRPKGVCALGATFPV